MDRRTELRQRSLAVMLATGTTVLGLWGVGVVLLIAGTAAQLPDPLAMNGDPCCPVPDTWAEVTGWSLAAALVAALDAGLLALAAKLLWFSLRGRWPAWRLPLLPLAAFPASLGLIALGLAARALA